MAGPKQPPKERPRGSDLFPALRLLDDAGARHERVYPGRAGGGVDYFAHLAALRQLTETFYARVLKPHRVSYSEFRVLSNLRLRDRDFRATPYELNQDVALTSAGITRTLDRLEASGYVDRVPNPDDRRSVLVGLTERGWGFAEALVLDVSARQSEAIAAVRTGERRAEVAAMRAIIERLAQALGG